MSDFSGDDLLKVFKELDIQLLNVNPNIVKAWFDTDDKNLLNLLNWMCVSLSKENYISPLEVAEYNAIGIPLTDEELEVEKEVLESKYPGIFDTEYNLLDIEFLEEDLNLARQREKELDQSIEMNRKLDEKLTEDLTRKVKEEIGSSVKLKTTQEKSFLESQKLDQLNEKIYNQLLNCTKVLHNFEFSPSPYFINNFNIDGYQEKIDSMLSILKPMLEKSPGTRNLTALTNVTSLDSMPLIDDTVASGLCNMRHRILHSQHQYLAATLEVEKLNAILSYLEKATIESLLSCDDSSLNQSIALKMETRKRLCDMLEDSTKKFAERHIAQTQLQYIEQELEMLQGNLTELTELEKMIQKMLSHYSVLRIMYDQEKNDMENFEKLFKKVIRYVNTDTESCVARTQQMKEIIENHNSSSSEERLKLTKTIVKILSSNEENFTIGRAYELFSDFYREIDFLETKLFIPGFGDIKAKGKDMRASIKVLQSFLVSGPTHRVLLIPSELQLLIRQVEELLKRQLDAVKSSIEIVSSAKKGRTKWQNYRRQLWMYFYADHSRLKLILQEIQEEFERSKGHKKE